MTYALIGLGNYGSEYEKTRHNIGFMVLDQLMRKYGIGSSTNKYHAEYQTGQIAGEKIHFLKPLTYMNRSGIAVSELVSFFKIPLENVIVFHDELDIEPFTIRMKQGGGAGGHNGLKSLDSHIGNNYHRVRIGIGRPQSKEEVTPWVLGNFKADDFPIIDHLAFSITEKMPLFFEKNPNEFKIKISKDYKKI